MFFFFFARGQFKLQSIEIQGLLEYFKYLIVDLFPFSSSECCTLHVLILVLLRLAGKSEAWFDPDTVIDSDGDDDFYSVQDGNFLERFWN